MLVLPVFVRLRLWERSAYTRVPLPLFDNGRLGFLEYPIVFLWVLHPFPEFQGFCVGLEIHGTAGVLPAFQDLNHTRLAPMVKVFRHGLPFLLCLIGGDSQHLVRRQDF